MKQEIKQARRDYVVYFDGPSCIPSIRHVSRKAPYLLPFSLLFTRCITYKARAQRQSLSDNRIGAS